MTTDTHIHIHKWNYVYWKFKYYVGCRISIKMHTFIEHTHFADHKQPRTQTKHDDADWMSYINKVVLVFHTNNFMKFVCMRIFISYYICPRCDAMWCAQIYWNNAGELWAVYVLENVMACRICRLIFCFMWNVIWMKWLSQQSTRKQTTKTHIYIYSDSGNKINTTG